MQSNNLKFETDCAFGETLVAFLYEEATASETEKFELHLKQCTDCREELAAFGYVRTAVADWRETGFETLEAPEITLTNQSRNFVQTKPERTESVSRLDSFRQFFASFNFGWQTSAAGIAAFVVLGLLFFGSTDLFDKREEMADAPAQNSDFKLESESIPRIEPKPNHPIVAQNPKDIGNLNQTTTDASKFPASSSRASAKVPKNSDSRFGKSNNAAKRQDRSIRTNRSVDDLNVLPADVEDRSLRLTDLLDEIEPSS